jgi:(E)-4-hydroxy-3-methylbut-2-enyl-diphosphate synthase
VRMPALRELPIRVSTLADMASERQIMVGGVPIGGGAPVVVQTMTKTETADLAATLAQIRRVADAGADLVRVAVPREKDAEALRTIVSESPIPVIADIHFNYTLALKALDAGAHCVRLNPGNIGGPEKVAQVAARAKELGTPLRIGVNSGSLPEHLRELEFTNPVEALVAAAAGFVELMESLDFTNFKVSMKSTSVPNTIASNRLLAEKIPYPLHLGITEAGTKWSGSLKSAVGLGTLLADGIGDTIRISLSTFHAEEEVKVAWEILKALKLRERGPVLIACPTCGRLQFDMDSVVAEIEQRLEAYEDPIEVSVLGCAVNGIGEARHADFGITGAKDAGIVYAKGEPIRKFKTGELVDALFQEIDKYYAAGKQVIRNESEAAEARAWLAENEDETAMTPERLAALEAAAADAEAGHENGEKPLVPIVSGRSTLDEDASPVAGRRFKRD